jgi:HPt (histidine-containing phosphotransfer) domain-containing protein
MPSIAEYQIFDRPDLLETLWGDEESVDTIVTMFIDGMPDEIASLADAVVCGDCSAGAEIAHKLKGMARNVRALRLGEVFARMENSLKSGDSPTAQAMMLILSIEFQEFQRFCASQ